MLVMSLFISVADIPRMSNCLPGYGGRSGAAMAWFLGVLMIVYACVKYPVRWRAKSLETPGRLTVGASSDADHGQQRLGEGLEDRTPALSMARWLCPVCTDARVAQ